MSYWGGGEKKLFLVENKISGHVKEEKKKRGGKGGKDPNMSSAAHRIKDHYFKRGPSGERSFASCGDFLLGEHFRPEGEEWPNNRFSPYKEKRGGARCGRKERRPQKTVAGLLAKKDTGKTPSKRLSKRPKRGPGGRFQKRC